MLARRLATRTLVAQALNRRVDRGPDGRAGLRGLGQGSGAQTTATGTCWACWTRRPVRRWPINSAGTRSTGSSRKPTSWPCSTGVVAEVAAEADGPGWPGTLVPAGRWRHDAFARAAAAGHRSSRGCHDRPAGLLDDHREPGDVARRGRRAARTAAPAPERHPVPLPTATIQRLGCNSLLSAVLVDAAGHPIGAAGEQPGREPPGNAGRCAPSWGASCAVKGCANTRTVPHHVRPWWISKQTKLADLAPLCEHCHHDLHEGRRTLLLRNGRYINDHGWVLSQANAA